MKKIVEMAHDILTEYIKEDSFCVDFTMGQGNDTLFLAQTAFKGHVIAFDIQEIAVAMTKQKLKNHKVNNVTLHLCSHADCDQIIMQPFAAGIFNFGYLPTQDKMITTICNTSAIAVDKALRLLQKQGILVLVLYPGHEQGLLEFNYFISYCKQLSATKYSVLKIEMSNQKQAPCIIAIEKKK